VQAGREIGASESMALPLHQVNCLDPIASSVGLRQLDGINPDVANPVPVIDCLASMGQELPSRKQHVNVPWFIENATSAESLFLHGDDVNGRAHESDGSLRNIKLDRAPGAGSDQGFKGG
jgi:hypothetical protein